MTIKTQWICDSCGEIINNAAEGRVEWLYFPGQNRIGENLRIVHDSGFSPLDKGCRFDRPTVKQKHNANVTDMPLSELTGPDGLMYLLLLIRQEAIEQDELMEMIKRTHVPGYEKVRLHIDDAIEDGIIDSSKPYRTLWQDEIESIQKWLNKK